MQDDANSALPAPKRAPWNKGKLTGAKPPLRPKHVWSNGSNWTERSESIPRFARWLGFKRTGPNIEDAARSVINSLIRSDRLEKTGSQIRRV